MEGELTEKLHSISYRATKAECLDLPETTDVIRQVELEPAALRIYRGLVKESYAELASGEVTATNILTRLLRLSQLTGGFLGNDETAAVEQVSAAKLSALEDILDGAMAEGKKLVTLRFLCPDPYGYALDDENFTLSQAGEHEVERETGNTDSEPVYSLQGMISSGALVLTTNGEALRVIGPLATEDVLVIDTGMVTAKVTDNAGNTLRNGLPCLEELNFPVLRRGVNEVTITAEGDAVFTELHIQAKSRWR